MNVIVVQPALPAYRLPLFERMAEGLGAGFLVYASPDSSLGVLESNSGAAGWLRPLGAVRSILPGIEWQADALSVPIGAGDVLIVPGAPRQLSSLALIFKARLKGAHTIWWGQYWSATSRSWRAALRYALMRLAEAVVFYTDKEVLEYRGREGAGLSKPVFGLNNGIETSEIAGLRARYVAAERTRDLLFIGRVTAKAELGVLVDALARPECRNVCLDVVGDGPTVRDLKEKAERLNVSERIAWHGATIDEERISDVANRCKAFVYPGCVGLSLIHGLAYGLPAIVHGDRWTNMPEIAAHESGRNGVVFDRGDARSLAGAIVELLGDQVALERMSAAAVATTERSFNVADMAERFITAINVVKKGR